MNKGLFLNKNLKVEVIDYGINYVEPKGLTMPSKVKSKIRIFCIDKSLDAIKFSDDKIISVNNQIKEFLGEDLSKYSFIISLERQESITTTEVMDSLKKMIDGADSIFITINIDEIKKDSIIFLNNPAWIHCDLDRPEFFVFWKYLKSKDLGTVKKKFMFLNNHYSEIRFEILKFLYENKFNNEGNISFNEINFSANKANLDREKFLFEVNHFGIEYPKYYDALPTLTQINENVLNRNSILGINHVTTLPDFNYRIYLESFFEILTETQPHLILPGVHISEKIHKPLRTAFPFVYYGNPKLKTILENIGLTFESPIYFFGMNKGDLFNHLKFLLSKDLFWYHEIQLKYLNEYFNNMDRWAEFIRDNNKQLIKFIFI